VVRIQVGTRAFSRHQKEQTDSAAHEASYRVPGYSALCVKQWGHEANHRPPSTAETKTERIYPSTFLSCLLDACRDKLAFDTDVLLYCNMEAELLMILLLSLLEPDEA